MNDTYEFSITLTAEHDVSGRVTDLNLLRIFDAVMLERNMTRAAERLHITQPAVSNAIQRLREVLKDDLFVKVAGGVNPSARAEAIWPTVRKSIQSLSDTLDPRAFDPAKANVSFRIAMSDYVVDSLIRPMVADLMASAPGIAIHASPNTVQNAVPMLIDGSIDMAVGVLAYNDPRIRSLLVQPVTYACVMRKAHRLAKGKLTLEQFMSARHLQVSLSGGISLIDRYLGDRGLYRDVALTINNFSLAPAILMETDLIAILPVDPIRNSRHRGKLHQVAAPIPVYEDSVSLLWHERNDYVPAHQWLRSKLVGRPVAAR